VRILMLSQFYPPITGGEEQHVRSLSIELVARGHAITVVTLWHRGMAEFELDEGVRVYHIRTSLQRVGRFFSDSGRQYAPPFPDPEAALALRSIITRERPEIIHAHNWLVYSFLPLKAWSGARLIVTLHNYNLVCPKMTMLYHNKPCAGPAFVKCLGCVAHYYGIAKGSSIFLSHQVMSRTERSFVDMFIAVSQSVAVSNCLIDNSLPFRVIPNFMPDDGNALQGDIDPYLAQLPVGDYLLFVGALSLAKGVDILLRAYANLTNAPPLILIGYPSPDWSVPKENCLHNVLVLENWPRYAVIEAYRRSTMALAPSLVPETFGMAVMEAMSVGCPVIASRVGNLVNLVTDGETGLLVDAGDSSTLQFAIEQLLANPELRHMMGQAAQRRVSEFQAGTVVSRIEQVYQEVLWS
jgi:glycosyltransferase involved in cell wall biosynthesis